MIDTMPLQTWQIVGRLIKEAARSVTPPTPLPVDLPPVGALVVESSHAWHHRQDWPLREAVGWVERIDSEDGNPIDRYGTNARVVLRLLDPGDGDPFQPWVNANFYVVPEAAALNQDRPEDTP